MSEALVQLAKAVADGQVRMALGDLDRLIRLESFSRDESDSRQEVVFANLRNKSDEELREMIKEEMEALRELEPLDEERCEKLPELAEDTSAIDA